MRSSFRTVLLLVGFSLVGACATTKTTMTSVWEDPALADYQINRVVVIGVCDTVSAKRLFEDEFVAVLTRRGMNAQAAYLVFTEEEEKDIDRLKAKIIEHGFDGVVVTRLLGIKKSERYVPPVSYVVPADYYNSFPGYYGTVYREVYAPGYIKQEELLQVETNIYAVEGEKLLFTGVSETFDPRAQDSVTKSIIKALVKEFK